MTVRRELSILDDDRQYGQQFILYKSILGYEPRGEVNGHEWRLATETYERPDTRKPILVNHLRWMVE